MSIDAPSAPPTSHGMNLSMEVNTASEVAFLHARDAHVKGDMDNAAADYARAIELDGNNADALHLLGVVHAQRQNYADAERLIRRALEIKEVWAYHDNLGKFLQEQGKLTEALVAYLRAIELKPELDETINIAAFIAVHLGLLDQAADLFHRLVTLHPEDAVVSNNLGNTLYRLHRYDDAEKYYRQAIGTRPDYAAAHYNLGILLGALQRHEEAIDAYREAIRLQPESPEALNNLGFIFQAQKRYNDAESAYRKALAIRPDMIDVITNLGNLYSDQKRYAEAEEQFSTAVSMAPDLNFDRVLLSYCKRQNYAWDGLQEIHDSIKTALTDGTTEPVEPLQLFSMNNISPLDQLRAGSNKINKEFNEILKQPPLVDPDRCTRGKRLRIGYLSADFCEHATMHLLLGVLENRDISTCETYLYSIGPASEDRCRQRARQACEIFRDLKHLDDRRAAEVIAADQIDILVDLKGFTADCRLGILAWRPAPIIAGWLGYPGTLGHPRLGDYIIGDPVVTPMGHAEHFSETLALLPHSYQPTDNRRPIGRKPARAEVGLPENGFVFCSFNQAFKLNPETFAVWCKLLREVPNSVLWLLEPVPSAIINLRRAAEKNGVAAARIIFAPWAPQEDHLGRLQLADLALDTHPYGSHTTGSDALWAGIPLVSRMGETFASRVSASLLTAVGLPELIARDWDEYFAIARRIALDPAECMSLRERLQSLRHTCPLFDTQRFSRDLHHLYHQIWRQHEAGERHALALSHA